MSKQEEANYSEFLTKVGFEEKTIKNILKSKDLAAKIHGIYTKTNFEEKCELKSGLIYTLCTINNPEINPHIDLISGHIFTGKIKNKQQLKLAETFVLKNKEVKDQGEFDKYCGVGVEVTDSDIDTYVRNFLKTNADLLRKNDFKITHPDVLNALKEGFQLANPTQLMKVATDLTKELFAEELKAVTEGGDKKKDKKKKEEAEVKENGTEEETFQKIDISKLVARDMAWSLNDEATMKKHLEVTGGKTITRFPPEPNGILHIGHARAIRFNFSIAGLYKGDCNLRYDDTNPEKEKKEYMDMIEDNVEWMGFKPSIKVHCSNYFPQIYDWTLELIKKGKAYACKLPVETMRKYKEDMIPSPYRDTTPEENLREFELMKSGYYDEGEIVLRAKIDYKSPVTTLRDPVLYRILYTPHPVSGSTWCIYPMYDYAHPLSDSIENITHSCCTLEFETRRELYYWPLQELGLYKPFVWEFSRLNIEYTLTSKRKILQLIADNVVEGWDDPRLYTLTGLRRRGIPIQALNEFLDLVPVTRRGNDNYIQHSFFDHVIKGWLDKHCPRYLAVSEPVHVELTNIGDKETKTYNALHFPNDPSKGSYPVILGRHIMVEKEDVRKEDAKGFFGIAPGKVIRLKYGPAIKITGVTQTHTNLDVKAEVLPEEEAEKLPTIKGVLNWVSKTDSVKAEFRLFTKLFVVPKPVLDANSQEARMKEMDLNSKVVCHNAKINKSMLDKLTPESRFQFERIGFFYLDPESDVANGKIIFNRIIETQNKKKETKED